MKKSTILMAVFLLSALVLAACGGSTAASQGADLEVEALQVAAPDTAGGSTGGEPLVETLVDEQGAVEVSVTPLNLEDDAATLDFEVALNTHSVDLSMDLSQLATLSTDVGAAVAAAAWDAPQGGHHVSGVLSFRMENDGASFLEGAKSITLTLEDVDAPTRTFTWNLN